MYNKLIEKRMFKVYWTCAQDKAYGKEFEKMTDALNFAQELRNVYKRRFVTIVSEDPNSVGKAGVDAVEDGVLPNGDSYSWKKRRA